MNKYVRLEVLKVQRVLYKDILLYKYIGTTCLSRIHIIIVVEVMVLDKTRREIIRTFNIVDNNLIQKITLIHVYGDKTSNPK